MGRNPAVGAVLFVVLVAFSLPAGGIVAADETADDDIPEPADEIHVNEDGDAVLIYQEESDENVTGEIGFDVAEDILYTFMVDENGPDDIEGDLGVDVDAESFAGAADVNAPAPEDVHELNLSLDGEQTADEAWAEAHLEMVVAADSDDMDGELSSMATEGTTIETAGSVSISADSVASQGTASVDPADVENDAFFDVTMTGTETGIDIDVVQQETVPDDDVEAWDTEENATETLQFLFDDGTAEELGGGVEITVDSHEFDDETNELDIEYSVEYEDVREGLGEMLAHMIAEDEELDLTEEQAERLADDLVGIDIETVQVTFDADATEETVTTDWTVDIQNLSPVIETTFDIAEESSENFDSEFEEARDRFDAADASDYEQTVAWDVSVDEMENTVAAAGSLSYDTENRAAYTDELDARDIEHADVTYGLNAAIDEETDRIQVDGSLTMQGDALLDRTLDSAVDALREDPEADEDAIDMLEAIQAADLDRAKMDASLQDGTVTVEAGASFDDISAFSDAVGEDFGDESIAHLYGDIDTNDETVYVYVHDLVDEDATEDDVRELAIADENTAVYMPGDDGWQSLDEFPRLDLQVAADYLDVELSDEEDDPTPTPTPEDDDDDFVGEDGAGFGVVAALLAMITGLLLARRQ